MNVGEEAIAIGNRMDGHDFKKKCSKVFSIGAFGMPPTPTQPLALDMHQAALNQNLRP
jgi:hypothetical protein